MTLDHRPPRPHHDVPDESEPGAPPVEPDEGPVPDLCPGEGTEPGREIGPLTGSAHVPLRAAHHRSVGVCP